MAESSLLENLSISEIFQSIFVSYKNTWLVFFWFIIFVIIISISVYFRRRALDYFDDYEKNSVLLDVK